MARAESVIRTSTYRINSMLLHLGTFAVGATLTRAAIDFDEQMTRTMAIMTDGSDGMRAAMEDVALGLSSSSITAPTELAKAYWELTRAGYAAAQSAAMLQSVERFSVINHMNAADAARHLSILQRDFGLGAADPEENARLMRSLGDSISSVAMASRANPSAFVEALTRIAPAMRAANQEVGQSVALLASFTSAHGSASRAAQQSIMLVDSLQRQMLKSETSPARGNAPHFLAVPAMGVFPAHGISGGGHAHDASHAWHNLGVEVFDAAGMMRPMTQIITDMDNAISRMSTQTRFATLTQLGFTRRTAEAMIELVGSSRAMQEFYLQSKNADGFMENVYSKHLQSFSAQWKIFRNNIEHVGILILRIVGPALRAVNNLLIRGVKAWTSLPSAARETTVAMLGAFLGLASLRFILPVVFALFKTLATPLYPLILLFRLLFIDSIRMAAAVKGLVNIFGQTLRASNASSGGLAIVWGLIPNIFLGIRAAVMRATFAMVTFIKVARQIGMLQAFVYLILFGISKIINSLGRGIHVLNNFLRAGTANFLFHKNIDLAISGLSRFGTLLRGITPNKIINFLDVQLLQRWIAGWDAAKSAVNSFVASSWATIRGFAGRVTGAFSGIRFGGGIGLLVSGLYAKMSILLAVATAFLSLNFASSLTHSILDIGLWASFSAGRLVGLVLALSRYISTVRVVPKINFIVPGVEATVSRIIAGAYRIIDAIAGINSTKVIVRGFEYLHLAANRALFAIYNIPGAIALLATTGSFGPILAVVSQLGKAFKQLKIGFGSFSIGLSLVENLTALRDKLITIATSTVAVASGLWKSLSNSFGLLQTKTAIKVSVGVQFVYEGISKAVTATYMLIEGFAKLSRARMIAPHVFRMGEFLEGIKLILVGLNSILTAFTGISVIDVFKNLKSGIATALRLPTTFGLFEGIFSSLTKRFSGIRLGESIIDSFLRIGSRLSRLQERFLSTKLVLFFTDGFFDNAKFGLMGLYDSFKSMRWLMKLEFLATGAIEGVLSFIRQKAFKAELFVTGVIENNVLPFLTRLATLPKRMLFRLEFLAVGLVEGIIFATGKMGELIAITLRYAAVGVLAGVYYSIYGIATAVAFLGRMFQRAVLGIGAMTIAFLKFVAVNIILNSVLSIWHALNVLMYLADVAVYGTVIGFYNLTAAIMSSTVAVAIFEAIASAGLSLLMTLIAIPLTIIVALLAAMAVLGVLTAVIVNTEGHVSSFGDMWNWVSSRAGGAFWNIIGFFYNFISNFNILINYIRKEWKNLWADFIEIILRSIAYIVINAIPFLINAWLNALSVLDKMTEGTWIEKIGIRFNRDQFQMPYRDAGALFGSASDYRSSMPTGLSLEVPEDIREMLRGFGRGFLDTLSPQHHEASGQGVGDTFKEMSLRRFVLEAPFTGVAPVQTVSDPTAAGLLEQIANHGRQMLARPVGLAP